MSFHTLGLGLDFYFLGSLSIPLVKFLVLGSTKWFMFIVPKPTEGKGQ
jgi:hypothetical protein